MNLKLTINFRLKIAISAMFLINLICADWIDTENTDPTEQVEASLNMGSCLSPAWMPWKDSKCIILIDSPLLTYEHARKWCMGLGDEVYWSTSLLELEGPEDLTMLEEILANYTSIYGGDRQSFWISTKTGSDSFQQQPLEHGSCQQYLVNRPATTTATAIAASDTQVNEMMDDPDFYAHDEPEGSNSQDGSVQTFLPFNVFHMHMEGSSSGSGSGGSGSGSGGSGAGDYFSVMEPTPTPTELIERNFLAIDFCSVKKPFICESPQRISLPKVEMTLTKMEEKVNEKEAEILKNVKVIGTLFNSLNETVNLRETVNARKDEVISQVMNLEQKFENKLVQMRVEMEGQLTKKLEEILLKKLDESLESIIPVGFVYVQLPNQPGPTGIWPKYTWEDISYKYEGLFFRTKGGNAAPYGQIQEDNSPRLYQVQSTRISWTTSSVYTNPGHWSGYLLSDYHGLMSGRKYGIQFYVSGGEVRPRNMAVKLWKRTATQTGG